GAALAARGAIPHDTSLGLSAAGFVAETCSTPGTAAFRRQSQRRKDQARSRLLALGRSTVAQPRLDLGERGLDLFAGLTDLLEVARRGVGHRRAAARRRLGGARTSSRLARQRRRRARPRLIVAPIVTPIVARRGADERRRTTEHRTADRRAE